jgi:hypothetical protein
MSQTAFKKKMSKSAPQKSRIYIPMQKDCLKLCTIRINFSHSSLFHKSTHNDKMCPLHQNFIWYYTHMNILINLNIYLFRYTYILSTHRFIIKMHFFFASIFGNSMYSLSCSRLSLHILPYSWTWLWVRRPKKRCWLHWHVKPWFIISKYNWVWDLHKTVRQEHP